MYRSGWYGFVFVLAGLVLTLGAIYEWGWFLSLSRRWNPYDVIGARSVKLFYAVVGTAMTGAGFGWMLQSLLATSSNGMFVIGFVVSAIITLILFALRNRKQDAT